MICNYFPALLISQITQQMPTPCAHTERWALSRSGQWLSIAAIVFAAWVPTVARVTLPRTSADKIRDKHGVEIDIC